MINIKKNGFTLVELIVVLGIVAATAVILGTNFMKLIGNVGSYEDEVIAKGIAEAAFVYYDAKENTNEDGSKKVSCITGELLIINGYIAPEQGLLKDYSEEDLKVFSASVDYVSGEKLVKVYKSNNCSGTEINYKD